MSPDPILGPRTPGMVLNEPHLGLLEPKNCLTNVGRGHPLTTEPTNRLYVVAAGHAPISRGTEFMGGAGIHFRHPRLVPNDHQSSVVDPFWG